MSALKLHRDHLADEASNKHAGSRVISARELQLCALSRCSVSVCARDMVFLFTRRWSARLRMRLVVLLLNSLLDSSTWSSDIRLSSCIGDERRPMEKGFTTNRSCSTCVSHVADHVWKCSGSQQLT